MANYYDKLSALYVKIRPDLKMHIEKICELESKRLRTVVEELLDKGLSDHAINSKGKRKRIKSTESV